MEIDNLSHDENSDKQTDGQKSQGKFKISTPTCKTFYRTYSGRHFNHSQRMLANRKTRNIKIDLSQIF